MLEGRGLNDLRHLVHHGANDLDEYAQDLGIASAFQGGTDTPGSIYITPEFPPERMGGWVPETGDALVPWLEDFLVNKRARVAKKLAASGREETHAFVLVPGLFAEAPFAAIDVLMADVGSLPTASPTLPSGISDVWIATPSRAGTAFRWSKETGWLRVSKAPT
jgi:hypothetical protein